MGYSVCKPYPVARVMHGSIHSHPYLEQLNSVTVIDIDRVATLRQVTTVRDSNVDPDSS